MDAQSVPGVVGESAQGLMCGLREQFRGLYSPSDDDWRSGYSNGHVVLDTNALLDVYRLSPSARTELFNVFEVLKPRLFVPYQVASEFHRRRVDAVYDRVQEFNSARGGLEEQHGKLKGILRNLVGRSLGSDDPSLKVFDSFEQAFADADQLIQRIQAEYDLDPDKISSGLDDPVLDRLDTILTGRVGPRPSDELLKADHDEAERRVNEKIPPGFRDKGKADNAHGDYLWWAEVVRLASSAPQPVILVCNDVAKGDWTLERRGFRVGAHPLLVDELWNAAGKSLMLCTTAQLLADAEKYLEVSVSEETVRETRSLPTHRSRLRPNSEDTLLDGDFSPIPLEIGFRGVIACNAAGITYRQLDYWARTGLIVPQFRGGGGAQRLYSFRDVLLLKVIKQLLDAGVALPQIRVAIEHLRARGVQDLTDVTLMSDGISVFEARTDDEVIDLLRSGGGMFGISLGKVWRDLEGKLLDLPAERAIDTPDEPDDS